jgi:Na+/melibiose symporter-like transporter
VVGVLSDNTATRFGRRKPWVIGGVIPEVVAWVFMWTSPGWADSETEKIIYFLAIILVFSTLSTITTVPYQALVPDLAQTYHDRTSLVMFSVFFSLVAAMLGTFAWSYAVTAFPVRPDDPTEAGMTYDYRSGYILAAALIGSVIFFSLIIGLTVVVERVVPKVTTIETKRPFWVVCIDGIKDFFRTMFQLVTFPPFIVVVGLNVLSALGQNFFMNSFVLYMKYNLESEAYTSRVLLILQVCCQLVAVSAPVCLPSL